MKRYGFVFLLVLSAGWLFAEESVIQLGDQRELFVDDYLIADSDGVELLLHQPQRKELTFIFDQPWEGDSQGYVTVIKAEDRYQMYYMACGQFPPSPSMVAYAESPDGIHWERVNLGFCEFNGSTENNLLMTQVADGVKCHDFNPFIDQRPGVEPDAKYKAIGLGHANPDREHHGLYAWKSADGIHWNLIQDTPVKQDAPFDTQNVAFWSEKEQCYVLYYRSFRDDLFDPNCGVRIVMKAVSDDFLHWTNRGEIQFPEGEGSRQDAQLYTNGILPYYRAPHLYLGFPARYVDHGITESTKLLPEWEDRQKRIEFDQREGTAVTDSVFISSRDGFHFREGNDVFVQPGLRTKHNWCYGDNFLGLNILETESLDDDSERELSFFALESYQTGGDSRLRRYVLRIDGFSSLHAKSKTGTVTTKPVQFSGNQLSLNCSTSAAGTIRVELQRADGTVIPGFSAEDSDLIYGDTLDRRVTWKGNPDLGAVGDEPIRIRFVMTEADIYSLRFVP